MTNYLEDLTTSYLPAFFAFGMKNTTNAHEAEEFAQEAAYQCVLAINKTQKIQNFNAFVWGIAHNTYKRWCARKKHATLTSNVIAPYTPPEADIIQEEEKRRIHLELSRLTDLYRKTIVCFYYQEMSIAETSEKLEISLEMVKFYLQKGRKKLKEAYTMPDNTGEKSFNPSEFTILQLAIDMTKVNVWEVFARKLPCQIALICYDQPKTVSEISLETGVPAVYLEEEISLLTDAGVVVSPVRNKYRTNFSIMKKNALKQLMLQFTKLHEIYAPYVIEMFDKYLPRLKECGVFKHEVPDQRYAWFFLGHVMHFANTPISQDTPAPVILSCGSRAFIFAKEAEFSPWTISRTPINVEGATVMPTDMGMLSNPFQSRSYNDLSGQGKAQALVDVYHGHVKDEDIEIYAQLLEDGYIIKEDGALYSNVATLTPQATALFAEINQELGKILSPLCMELHANVCRIVKATIPPQLKEFAEGYTQTWVEFYAYICFCEALYGKGFIVVPEDGDKSPVACVVALE